MQTDQRVKKVKKPYQQQDLREDMYQQISDYEYSDEQQEDVDQKRVRLAKQILRNARNQVNQQSNQNEQINDDDFFKTDDLQVGVEREQDEKVNEILQRDVMRTRNMLKRDMYVQMEQSYKQQNMRVVDIKGHKNTVNNVELDQNNKHVLYSSGKDNAIIQWDLEKQCKVVINKMAHTNNILAMDLNWDNSLLVSGGMDRIIKIWDVRSNKLVKEFKGHRGCINDIRWARNRNEFASISEDKQLKQYDFGEQCLIDSYYGHKDSPYCIENYNDRDYVTCGMDKQIIVWQMENSSQMVFANNNDYSVDNVIQLDQQHFIASGQQGMLQLYSQTKKKPVQKIDENVWNSKLYSMFNSDLVLSAGVNGQLNVYNYRQNQINYGFTVHNVRCLQ